MTKKPAAKNIVLFVLGMLLGAAAALPGCAAVPAERSAKAQPVAELTAVWGSFDEIRLFRYFDPDAAGEDNESIPCRAEYGGKDYVLAGTDGPFETQWGLCLEAMYAGARD